MGGGSAQEEGGTVVVEASLRVMVPPGARRMLALPPGQYRSVAHACNLSICFSFSRGERFDVFVSLE